MPFTAILFAIAILARVLPWQQNGITETTNDFFAELQQKAVASETLAPITFVEETAGAMQDLTVSVYITRSGERYHKQNCYQIKRSTTVSAIPLSEAIKEGYTECKSCYK